MYRQLLQNIAREASFPVDRFGPDHFVLTAAMVGELRQLSYLEQWRAAMDNEWFHVKMQDHSLFLFSEGLQPSYWFVHCPLEIMSFPEFVKEQGLQDSPASRRALSEDYNRVLETASERKSVTPIRFDYHPKGYTPGTHPVAHVHIGLENKIRLSSNKMSAVSFVLFVMRQMYPESWAVLLSRPNRDKLASSIRAGGTAVPADYWNHLDQIELHFR